jgi:hypothetical protein
MRLTLPVDPWFRTDPLDPFENLPVGLDNSAQILAKAILVQNSLLAVGDAAVPETAIVGTDLIGQQ